MIDILVDLQDEKNPKSILGTDFRSALQLLSESPFRVRPWFYLALGEESLCKHIWG